MCTTTISTLTLASLLRDPLIQLVMRSDNVSEKDHSELLYRVQEALLARETIIPQAVGGPGLGQVPQSALAG